MIVTDSSTSTSKNEMYFITLMTSHDVRHHKILKSIFEQRAYSDIIVKTLIYLVDHYKLNLYGFVILSDQIHLIIGTNEEDLHENIEILKSMSAREIMLHIGKKLSKMDENDNRKEVELRKVFGSYLNHDESVFWGKNKKFLKLQQYQDQHKISPITSEILIAHLADKNRNYLQLGANAFTKLMMNTM
jgi:hypothetical protein